MKTDPRYRLALTAVPQRTRRKGKHERRGGWVVHVMRIAERRHPMTVLDPISGKQVAIGRSDKPSNAHGVVLPDEETPLSRQKTSLACEPKPNDGYARSSCTAPVIRHNLREPID